MVWQRTALKIVAEAAGSTIARRGRVRCARAPLLRHSIDKARNFSAPNRQSVVCRRPEHTFSAYTATQRIDYRDDKFRKGLPRYPQ
ncbi:hypothetical protein RR46_05669 [Papilio xuthus]|uniref:Uncharacterized protein n=1 Tax=Papilio xuthus TaxID=66420 RepID=A0A194PUQ0_PAPXU|nr:hypothetical protein RR46_05669 [Papilio xuthus]